MKLSASFKTVNEFFLLKKIGEKALMKVAAKLKRQNEEQLLAKLPLAY